MHFLSALHCGCGVCVCVFQVESYYGIGDKISDLIEGTGNLTETQRKTFASGGVA